MPDVGKSSVVTESPEGVRLLTILLGLEGNAADVQNKRNINFLGVRNAKSRKSGMVYNTKTLLPEGIYDSWGYPFVVELNTGNRERLEFTVASRTIKLEGRLLAVHSPGADGKTGTADDVRTW